MEIQGFHPTVRICFAGAQRGKIQIVNTPTSIHDTARGTGSKRGRIGVSNAKK